MKTEIQNSNDSSLSTFLPPEQEKYWRGLYNENELSRKEAQSFLQILQGRAALEIEYGSRIQEMAQDLRNLNFKGLAVKKMLDSLVLEFTHQGEQATVLGNAVKQDVVSDTILPTLNNHFSVQTNIYRDISIQAKNLETTFNKFTSAKSKFQSSGLRAEAAAIVSQNCAFESSKQRTKSALRALSFAEETAAAEEEYELCRESLLEARRSYSKQISKIIPCLEEMQEKRKCCIVDSTRKFFIHSISCTKTCQYELDDIVKCYSIQKEEPDGASNPTETTDSSSSIPVETEAPNESDIVPCFPELPHFHWTSVPPDEASILSNSRKPEIPLAPIAGAALQWLNDNWSLDLGAIGNNWAPGLSVKSTVDSAREGSESKTLSSPEPDAEELSLQFDSYVSRLFDSSWPSFDFIEETAAILPSLCAHTSRNVLCRSLLAMKSLDIPELPSKFQFSVFSRLCNEMLTYADKEFDVWCGRAVLVMSQFFYFLGGAEEDPEQAVLVLPRDDKELMHLEEEEKVRGDCRSHKWTLARAVILHPLWNKEQFWEEALVITVAEIKQKKILSQRWKTLSAEDARRAEDKFRSNQISSSSRILERFASLMTAFGIHRNGIVNLLGRMMKRFKFGSAVNEIIMMQIENMKKIEEDKITEENEKEIEGKEIPTEIVE